MSRKARNAITGEEQEEVPTVVILPVVCPNKECGSSNRSTASYTHVDSGGEIDGQAYTGSSGTTRPALIVANDIESRAITTSPRKS